MPDSSFLQVWNVFTMLAMMLELVVVCKTTQLTIFMPGLSLRGPEGSVSRAVGIMREEHEKVVRFFGAGILCFVFSAMCQCWILFGFYDKDYCVAAGGRWVEDGDLPLRPGTPRCDFVRPIPPLTPPCLTIASLCLTAPPCPNSPLARPRPPAARGSPSLLSPRCRRAHTDPDTDPSGALRLARRREH